MKFRKQTDTAETLRLSRRGALVSTGAESRTVQSERDNCDLNILVKRFGVEPLIGNPGNFDVWDSSMNLHDALEIGRRANEQFMSLPSGIRARFENDPVQLLAAIQESESNDALRTELEELGIFRARSQPTAEPDRREAEPSEET